MVVPVDCPSGLISFEAEAIATKELLNKYPHIKMIVDLTATNSWSIVLGNQRLRIGSHSAATKLFISLGIGLKVSLNKGTITVNPHGKTNGATERKEHKKHKKHKTPVPSLTQRASQIASCAEPGSFFLQCVPCFQLTRRFSTMIISEVLRYTAQRSQLP